MKIIRFAASGGGPAQYGWAEGGRAGKLVGDPFGTYRREDLDLALGDLTLLAPLSPGKIVCVGRNYLAHAQEHGVEVPEVPLLFLKPPSAVIGPGQAIVLPPQSDQVEHEAELAVVIGRRARDATPEEAAGHILGYTVANDVTARDLQQRDGQWTRAKGFDTFCPLGPWIETSADPSDLRIVCRVNGVIRQMASTQDMVFGVPQLVAYISGVMTLEPGDVILTGTPEGVGRLGAGDRVEIEIQDIGLLRNEVRLAAPGRGATLARKSTV
jgi:2-keto-4-pentenoate hydratase/2-oxohepta-3-ene-1,7-dioic acid hydratase in catechol pathway